MKIRGVGLMIFGSMSVIGCEYVMPERLENCRYVDVSGNAVDDLGGGYRDPDGDARRIFDQNIKRDIVGFIAVTYPDGHPHAGMVGISFPRDVVTQYDDELHDDGFLAVINDDKMTAQFRHIFLTQDLEDAAAQDLSSVLSEESDLDRDCYNNLVLQRYAAQFNYTMLDLVADHFDIGIR
jgi:hypothetical protein